MKTRNQDRNELCDVPGPCFRVRVRHSGREASSWAPVAADILDRHIILVCLAGHCGKLSRVVPQEPLGQREGRLSSGTLRVNASETLCECDGKYRHGISLTSYQLERHWRNRFEREYRAWIRCET